MKKVIENKNLTRYQKQIYKQKYFIQPTSVTDIFETESVYQKTIDNELENTFLFNNLYEDIFYGKINKKNNPIVPNSSFLSAISFFSGNKYSFSFVVDAYKNLVDDWKRLLISGKITEEQNLKLEPKNTYVNFEIFYRKEIYNCYNEFIDFIEFSNLDSSIADLESFIKVFSKFLPLYIKSNPFFISDFILSKRCPHVCTGLSIQLQKDFYSYKDKDTFISSNEFQIFSELCYLNGFIIEKNNPSNLFFDIKSKHAQKYINGYLSNNETFEKDFYNKFFVETKTYDLYFFKNYIMLFYNFFVDLKPVVNIKTNYSCNNTLKTKINKIERKKITRKQREENFDNQTSHMWWKFYLFVYFLSKNINVNQSYFESIVVEMVNLSSVLDEDSLFGYLEQKAQTLPRSKLAKTNFSY